MNHSTYIRNLFESFIQQNNTVMEKVMFIKHYNTFSISLESIEKEVGSTYADGLLYHHFAKNDIKEPYEPFISGIRYYYHKFYHEQYTVEEFIEKCNIYSLHKEIFISYINTGKTNREEPLVLSDLEYEKKKFISSIINCYNYIGSEHNILIVLNRLHLSGVSGIRLISKIISMMDKIHFKLLVIYNELFTTLPYIETEFNGLIEKAVNYNILFEWDGNEITDQTDYHTNFVPSKRFFIEYLTKLENLNTMLAIEDAGYYLDIIYQRLVQEKLDVDTKHKFDLFAIRALNYIYINNTSGALLVCEKLLPLFTPGKDLEFEYSYNMICGIAQMTLIQSDLAIKYANRCIEVAKKLEDENLLFYAKILKVSAKFNGWRDVFSVDFRSVKVDNDMVKQLRQRKFYNTLAYYLSYGCDNTVVDIQKIIIGHKNSEHFDEAIRLGRMIGNTNFLLSAYTKNIVVYTDKGLHKYVYEFYQEKLKILQNEENTRRQANLYLGMGYNAIISEQFALANEYINKAISVMYKLKNPETIAEGLYNLTINCICAQDYYSACNYLQTIFKMVSNLGFETIQICNASKLYGLLAFTYYKIGNDYRCCLCLSKIEIQISHILEPNVEHDYSMWHEDLFLYYFVKGLLEKDNSNLDEALTLFEKAEFHYNQYLGAKFYNTIEFVVEYYKLLKKLGKNEKAEQILNDAIKFCNDNGYTFKNRAIITGIEDKNNFRQKFISVPCEITNEQMLELSFAVGVQTQLINRKKDINFLSAWQEMLNQDDIEETKLTENAITTLQNNFNLDRIIILTRDNNVINPLYSMNDSKLGYSDYEKIFSFFDATKKEFIINRTDKRFLEYESLLSLFNRNEIVSLVGIPISNEKGVYSIFLAIVNMHSNFRRNRILLKEENLVIIKTAFFQLNNDFERIRNRKGIVEMNKKLKELAITDMLTGLYNRQGFAKMIEEDSNCDNSITILYADLDNFKYYNDTFGHDVGDTILVEFARLFSKVCKKIGYAVRYGGDEFIIVLKNVSIEDAVNVADNIYTYISDGFIEVVKSITNKNVVIPENKKVSCSIGIARSDKCTELSITDTLKQADKALYYMKNNHKGSYFVWEEIDGKKE